MIIEKYQNTNVEPRPRAALALAVAQGVTEFVRNEIKCKLKRS